MCPYEIALWGGLRMPYAKELLYVYCSLHHRSEHVGGSRDMGLEGQGVSSE